MLYDIPMLHGAYFLSTAMYFFNKPRVICTNVHHPALHTFGLTRLLWPVDPAWLALAPSGVHAVAMTGAGVGVARFCCGAVHGSGDKSTGDTSESAASRTVRAPSSTTMCGILMCCQTT
jgi:hypothetical protein